MMRILCFKGSTEDNVKQANEYLSAHPTARVESVNNSHNEDHYTDGRFCQEWNELLIVVEED